MRGTESHITRGKSRTTRPGDHKAETCPLLPREQIILLRMPASSLRRPLHLHTRDIHISNYSDDGRPLDLSYLLVYWLHRIRGGGEFAYL